MPDEDNVLTDTYLNTLFYKIWNLILTAKLFALVLSIMQVRPIFCLNRYGLFYLSKIHVQHYMAMLSSTDTTYGLFGQSLEL